MTRVWEEGVGKSQFPIEHDILEIIHCGAQSTRDVLVVVQLCLNVARLLQAVPRTGDIFCLDVLIARGQANLEGMTTGRRMRNKCDPRMCKLWRVSMQRKGGGANACCGVKPCDGALEEGIPSERER